MERSREILGISTGRRDLGARDLENYRDQQLETIHREPGNSRAGAPPHGIPAPRAPKHSGGRTEEGLHKRGHERFNEIARMSAAEHQIQTRGSHHNREDGEVHVAPNRRGPGRHGELGGNSASHGKETRRKREGARPRRGRTRGARGNTSGILLRLSMSTSS